MTEQVVLATRTAEQIAEEINGIKTETFRFLEAATKFGTMQAFEIGKRLVEAKGLVAGSWIDWLRDSVSYSEDTAQNLMRIYREYSPENPVIQGMSYSQLVALFPVPVEKRAEFAEENGVEQLSVKEIKKLIRDKDAAEKKLKTAESKASKLEASRAKLEEQLKDAQQIAERDKSVASKALDEKKALEKELNELKTAPPKIEKVVEQVPGEVTEEQLEEVRAQVRSEYEEKLELLEKEKKKQDPLLVEINFYFNQVQSELNMMGSAIKRVPKEQATQLREIIRKTVTKLLQDHFGGS